MAAGHAALFEIALVIFFGGIKFSGGRNFGGDGLLKFFAGFEFGFGFFGDGDLFRRMGEDRGAVLLAEVGSLAIHLGWIVQVPEGFDQSLVADFGWIEFDLDDFGVAGLVGADVFVRGIFSVAVAVADEGVDDAGDHAEFYFDSPEAAGGKGSEFSHGANSLPEDFS